MELTAAFKLLTDQMEKHGLTAQGWSSGFNNRKRSFGVCKYREQRIELSRQLTELNPEAEILDTILHEIAHALMPGCGHNWAWKMRARAIGAKPEACKMVSDVQAPRGTWVAKCPGCGVESHKYSRPRSKKLKACGACCNRFSGGRFDPKFAFCYARPSDAQGEVNG